MLAYPTVLAGHERDHLVGALAGLRAELGLGEVPQAIRRREEWLPGTGLGEDEEELVGAVAEELAKLVAATAATHPPPEPLPEAISAGAIAGAEWVMRSVMRDDGPAGIADLIPDFVYLVTLPFLAEEGSLAAARRSRELIEATDGRGDG